VVRFLGGQGGEEADEVAELLPVPGIQEEADISFDVGAEVPAHPVMAKFHGEALQFRQGSAPKGFIRGQAFRESDLGGGAKAFRGIKETLDTTKLASLATGFAEGKSFEIEENRPTGERFTYRFQDRPLLGSAQDEHPRAFVFIHFSFDERYQFRAVLDFFQDERAPVVFEEKGRICTGVPYVLHWVEDDTAPACKMVPDQCAFPDLPCPRNDNDREVGGQLFT
jgi:hypothetical protein